MTHLFILPGLVVAAGVSVGIGSAFSTSSAAWLWWWLQLAANLFCSRFGRVPIISDISF